MNVRTLNPLIIVGVLALGGCASSRTSQSPNFTTKSDPGDPGNNEQQEGRAAEDPHGDQHGGEMARGEMASTCPMTVDGTSVRADEVDNAVSITFTTTGDVGELRQRVARLAEVYNRQQAGGGGSMMHMQPMPGEAAPADDMHDQDAQRGLMMPPSTASVEDIEAGARLVITPNEPTKLPTLRQHAQQMAGHMQARQCPMLHGTT
jgi:hypothetical protein